MIVFALVCYLLVDLSAKSLDNHVIPLYSNSSRGVHYANIYIGSPPQEQSVYIVTGATLLVVPCQECTQCNSKHLNPFFKHSQSSTAKVLTCGMESSVCKCVSSLNIRNNCTFQVGYTQGSYLQGYFVEDIVSFGNGVTSEAIRSQFGCIRKEINMSYSEGVNGIFGFAPKRLNHILQTLHQQHSQHSREELLFSMSLRQSGGELIIGRKPQIDSSTCWVKTGYDATINKYSLKEVGFIKMGGEVIKEFFQDTGSEVIIESGTSFTFLPKNKYAKVLATVKRQCKIYHLNCKAQGNDCFQITALKGKDRAATLNKIFPSFDIQIADSIVGWSPSQYFFLKNKKQPSLQCLAFWPSHLYLLGNRWMRDRTVVFNLANQTIQISHQSPCPPVPIKTEFKDVEKGEGKDAEKDKIKVEEGKDVVKEGVDKVKNEQYEGSQERQGDASEEGDGQQRKWMLDDIKGLGIYVVYFSVGSVVMLFCLFAKRTRMRNRGRQVNGGMRLESVSDKIIVNEICSESQVGYIEEQNTIKNMNKEQVNASDH